MSPRSSLPNDALRAWLDDLSAALALLTRLPVPRARAPESARAVRAYPLAGALVGLIGGGAFWLAEALGLPPLAAGLLAVGATVLATGAFHEDGLADLADGFGGARERERKLAIMRDSRIGSFGVIALVLSIGLRAAALAALASGVALVALVAAHALARAALPPIMALLPLARETGLAAATGRPDKLAVWTGLAIALVIAVIALGSGPALLALALAAAAAGTVALLARAQIGGYTGDVLGAAAQAAEVAVLLGLAAL